MSHQRRHRSSAALDSAALAVLVCLIDLNAGGQSRSYPGALPPSDSDAACRELIDIGALTITFADVRPIGQTADKYCHVRGSVQPGIRYHVDLPLPSKWNGRFIGFGDPGADGIIFSSNPFVQSRSVGKTRPTQDSDTHRAEDRGTEESRQVATWDRRECRK